MDGLASAASAEFDGTELPASPHEVGREVMMSAAASGAWLHVAERDYDIVGAIRVVPREFQRSRHIGEVLVLVHPEHRSLGIGGAMVDAALAAERRGAALVKLVARVAADDGGLRQLLAHRGFVTERVERGALRRGGRPPARGPQLVDVEVMALHLDETRV